MKTSIILFVILLLAVSIVRADEAAYVSVLKERDAVLSELLAKREKQYASGAATEDAVVSARLALFSFRRDTAKATAEKIKQQEAIVSVQVKRLAVLKARPTTGEEDILIATDALLQAKQTLEELRLK